MPDLDPFHGLTSPRLRLRRMRPEDAPILAAYRSDPEVARYQSWESCTLERARDLIARQQGLVFGTPGAWHQVGLEERATGRLVGDCAFHVQDDPQQCEIGFTVSRTYQGQGLAQEGCRALLGYAFETMGVHRVRAVIDVRNAAAERLLERLGFRREAHLIENLWFKGAWGSEYIYALLKRGWGSPIGSDAARLQKE